MASNKALWVNRQGFKLGASKFGKHGQGTGSAKQIVHDGDTVNISLDRNIAIRFLGIDTPEISLQFPGSESFVAIKDERWADFFSSGRWKWQIQLDPELMGYLENKIGDGKNVSTNHSKLAKEAEDNLEKLVSQDLVTSGKEKTDFSFFMAFAHEFLDGYGRLLCYLHPDKENFDDKKQRISYNERQLADGYAEPYFIWPNIQPFIKIRPFEEESITPSQFWTQIEGSKRLALARKSVKEARQAQKGIFGQERLLVSAFELRFLARKRGPDRYVIDLENAGSNKLLPPEKYHQIQYPEDRLFVPREYVPIFRAYGWDTGD